LIHGPGILGGFTILTGSIYLKHYRRFFQLRKVGMMTTFVPTCILPAGGAMILHHNKIQNELLRGQLNCPTCAEIRALFIQVGLGFLYPVLLAPIVTMAVAKKDLMYPLPPLTEPIKVLELVKKASKPLYPWIVAGVVLHFGVTIFVVHKEGQAFAKIMKTSPLQHVR
jgi:transmembrane protein 126A